MDFDLSDEQRMLEDGLRRFIAERYGPNARRRSVESVGGFSRELWQDFADMGWLGVGVPEAQGGLGGGPVDLMVVMERLGYGLVVEPYLATVVLAGGLLARTGDPAQLLVRLAAGEAQLGVAFAEPQARFDLHDVVTRADPVTAGWRLNGSKTLVLNAPNADWLIVVARTSGGQRDAEGLSLFLVPATAPGLEVRPVRTQDDFPAGEVRLSDVVVPAQALLGPKDCALAAIEAAVDAAIMADAAYALGCMEFLLATTADYLKTRKQFGKPLASFQVLQHRLVQMHVALEEARSLVIGGTLALAEAQDDEERLKAVAATKIQVNHAARLIGQESIQMHGGIGMTEALIVGVYYKRLLAVGTLFGDSDHHLGRLADRIAA
jgi:alkylation response protein AidB-like acyl-CoA dehydrogenase